MCDLLESRILLRMVRTESREANKVGKRTRGSQESSAVDGQQD